MKLNEINAAPPGVRVPEPGQAIAGPGPALALAGDHAAAVRRRDRT